MQSMVLALVLAGVVAKDAEKKSITVECVHVIHEIRAICFDFLPFSEYNRIMPLLKQAIRGLVTSQKHFEPEIILRVLQLTDPVKDANDIVRSEHIRDHVTNPPKLKQWYRSTLLGKDGRLYGVTFGETAEGKGYMSPNGKLRYLPDDYRLDKTKKLLAEGNLTKVYEFWKPPQTATNL